MTSSSTTSLDAAVIAAQVRIRGDLQPLRPDDETDTDLKIVTGLRMDLVADRTRTVTGYGRNRLGSFPALSGSGPHEHRPAQLAGRLPDPGCLASTRHPAAGDTASQAAERQHTACPARA
ncbi:transposase [Streptomyces collinus]|uniref:IS110 family transposase n=1 Tax=Streptomyces collinus TaxID=42684 RepID=UPI0036C16C08